MDSSNESYHDIISTEILEDICDGSQSHTNVNKRESSYKICHCISQRQSENKVSLKSTQNMGKILHKVFKTVVKDSSQYFSPLGESGSEVSILFQNLETLLK